MADGESSKKSVFSSRPVLLRLLMEQGEGTWHRSKPASHGENSLYKLRRPPLRRRCRGPKIWRLHRLRTQMSMPTQSGARTSRHSLKFSHPAEHLRRAASTRTTK